ncbi:MAG: SRPBCC family protein, partial [Candidatus Obscuribacterales bacterium]|nr:SRPBCC family protein [Candidatus Obscuribacterales bacterium]
MQRKKIGTLCLAMACVFMSTLAVEAKTTAASDSKIVNSIELVNAAPGKIVHSHKFIDGKKYHVTRALINTAPVHVWSLLTDYDRAEEVFTNVKDIQLVSFAGNQKKVKFEVASLGGLWKFNYVLAVTETAPHQIEWRRESGAFKSNEGYWQLEGADSGNSTLVT